MDVLMLEHYGSHCSNGYQANDDFVICPVFFVIFDKKWNDKCRNFLEVAGFIYS